MFESTRIIGENIYKKAKVCMISHIAVGVVILVNTVHDCVFVCTGAVQQCVAGVARLHQFRPSMG